jgi:hypothetical protein
MVEVLRHLGWNLNAKMALQLLLSLIDEIQSLGRNEF